MPTADPDLASSPVVGLAEHYAAGEVAPHHHRRAQILYAVSGSMTAVTDEGRWVIPPSRALWIPGGARHALVVRRGIALRTLYLDESIDWVPRRAACEVIQVAPLVRELILAAVAAEWDYGPDSATTRLVRVLCDRLVAAPQEPVYLPAPTDPRAQRVAAIYRREPADHRTISELGRVVGASPRTLERLFLAQTGLPLGQWVQQLRLISAMERIADDEPVGDAAFAVGYQNPSSFIAVFKRRFGTTPAQYFG